jgi:hypothetical protein
VLRRNIELALFQRKYWRRAAGGARKTARVPHSIAFCAIEWGHDTLRLSKNPSPLTAQVPQVRVRSLDANLGSAHF